MKSFREALVSMTDAEAMALWNAVSQYVENGEDGLGLEDCDTRDLPAATSAMDKLGSVVAGLAGKEQNASCA